MKSILNQSIHRLNLDLQIHRCSSDLSEMDDDLGSKREDVDGEWYTRRQFYDYYGSDEDNLDPNVYHQYRYDDQYGTWATKEEFYQHYGSDRI